MYQDFKEVVYSVRLRFFFATSLSKGASGECFYGHEYNGIGCAIGCLFSPDVAHQFDENYVGEVNGLKGDEDFEEMFGPISMDYLADLQSWHDTSNNVEEFIKKLDDYLA